MEEEIKSGTEDENPAAVTLIKAYLGESPLVAVIGETVSLFHRLRVVTEEIHHQGEMTSGKRGVLGSLDRFGPQTVPQMARSRPVSRQYIQMLVNELLNERYVEQVENPAHKRSRLVSITPKGKDLFNSMMLKEAMLLSQLKIEIPQEKLLTVAEVLRSLRELFESKEWRQLVKTIEEKKNEDV